MLPRQCFYSICSEHCSATSPYAECKIQTPPSLALVTVHHPSYVVQCVVVKCFFAGLPALLFSASTLSRGRTFKSEFQPSHRAWIHLKHIEYKRVLRNLRSVHTGNSFFFKKKKTKIRKSVISSSVYVRGENQVFF